MLQRQSQVLLQAAVADDAANSPFKTMPRGQRNPETIDWFNSESKQIVLDDLEAGVISLDETDSAEALFYGMYQYTPEFIAEKVQFKQFKERLAGHREQLKHKLEAPAWERAALEHDRLKRPKKTHNDRGEKIFYWSKAMQLLKKDIEAKKHHEMTPSQLKASRPEYRDFTLAKFDGRIRQAIRKERLINWKNDKRQEEIDARKERRRDLQLSEETPQEQWKRLERERREQREQQGL